MTGFRYAVLRYMPDATRQEFVNVGIVVTPEDAPPVVKMMTSSQSNRIKCLGHSGDMTFLLAVQRDLKGWGPAAYDTLAEASREWGGTVRVSEVHGALHESPNRLCDELYDRYVGSSVKAPRDSVRDRNTAKRLVRESLRAVLPKESVKPNPRLDGSVEQHRFDVGVINGSLLHVISALSFDIKTDRLLAAEVDACAWAIADVRTVAPSLPISVVTLGDSQQKLLSRAESVYQSLGAQVVPEEQMGPWARGIEAELSDKILQTSAKPSPTRP